MSSSIESRATYIAILEPAVDGAETTLDHDADILTSVDGRLYAWVQRGRPENSLVSGPRIIDLARANPSHRVRYVEYENKDIVIKMRRTVK